MIVCGALAGFGCARNCWLLGAGTGLLEDVVVREDGLSLGGDFDSETPMNKVRSRVKADSRSDFGFSNL